MHRKDRELLSCMVPSAGRVQHGMLMVWDANSHPALEYGARASLLTEATQAPHSDLKPEATQQPVPLQPSWSCRGVQCILHSLWEPPIFPLFDLLRLQLLPPNSDSQGSIRSACCNLQLAPVFRMIHCPDPLGFAA